MDCYAIMRIGGMIDMAFQIDNSGLIAAAGTYNSACTTYATSRAKIKTAMDSPLWNDKGGSDWTEVATAANTEFEKIETNLALNRKLLNEMVSKAAATQQTVRTNVQKLY